MISGFIGFGRIVTNEQGGGGAPADGQVREDSRRSVPGMKLSAAGGPGPTLVLDPCLHPTPARRSAASRRVVTQGDERVHKYNFKKNMSNARNGRNREP